MFQIDELFTCMEFILRSFVIKTRLKIGVYFLLFGLYLTLSETCRGSIISGGKWIKLLLIFFALFVYHKTILDCVILENEKPSVTFPLTHFK